MGSKTEAKEEVMITLETAELYFWIASKIPVVPLMAGCKSSVSKSVAFRMKGEAV